MSEKKDKQVTKLSDEERREVCRIALSRSHEILAEAENATEMSTRGLCENCNKRPGTQRWIGEGGSLAVSHGMYSWWCELCCLRAQLEHAEKLAVGIPELKKKIELEEGKEKNAPGFAGEKKGEKNE